MGVFEDITDLYEESGDTNFLEGSIASCYYDGKLYGLPWGNNCLGLFYNEQLLQEAGVEVPTTWSELEAACEKLTKDGTYGLAISAINNEEGTFQFMPWLLSAGGSVDDLSSDASKEAMTYLKGLIDKGYVSSECVNWTQADAEKQFASGKAAMMINGPWQFSGLEEDAPRKIFAEKEIGYQVNSVASLGSIFFTETPVVDYQSAKTSDTAAFSKYFEYMLEHGVHLAPSQFEAIFLSDAHTEEDIQQFLELLNNYF